MTTATRWSTTCTTTRTTTTCGAHRSTPTRIIPRWAGRSCDPNAFFDTSLYLALNSSVKAAGIDPLTDYQETGWKDGRVPSFDFDPHRYLADNPDVAATNVDPLEH